MPSQSRVAVLLGTALVGALLPGSLTAPAQAADCLSEPPTGLPGTACDDTVAPDTTLTGVSTPPNAAGWVSATTMSFSFTGAHADQDTDALSFQCRLIGPAHAHDWTTCESPRTYTGLVDTDGAAYTFEVRAVDTTDQAFTYRSSPLSLDDEPGEDHDGTPPTVSWGQDTKPPVAFVTPDLYDEETPSQPVAASRAVAIRLNSNEPDAGFQCQDDGESIPCSPGNWSLTGAGSGRHFFSARAVDRAGNASAWSEPFEFYVPTNLRRQKGWRTRSGGAFLDGDVVTTTSYRRRLVLPRQKVGELRLYAPTAPSYGKVRIKIGHTSWRTVSLKAPRAARREFVVIDRYQGSRTGKIYIEVVSRNKRVLLDAIVARTNVFRGD